MKRFILLFSLLTISLVSISQNFFFDINYGGAIFKTEKVNSYKLERLVWVPEVSLGVHVKKFEFKLSFSKSRFNFINDLIEKDNMSHSSFFTSSLSGSYFLFKKGRFQIYPQLSISYSTRIVKDMSRENYWTKPFNDDTKLISNFPMLGFQPNILIFLVKNISFKISPNYEYILTDELNNTFTFNGSNYGIQIGFRIYI